MSSEAKKQSKIVAKAKNTISTVKEYWSVPPKGKYVPYKEIAALSGAGFGVNWLTLLSSQIALSAGNFLVGASIGLAPVDLQIMLTVANILGIPLGIFRGWYYDNHNLKGGKFLPFIKRTALPIVLISAVFVWIPYERFDEIIRLIMENLPYDRIDFITKEAAAQLPYDRIAYIAKAVVVWLMYFLLSQFNSFYNESYTYFQQIFSPDAQERANVMSISQVIYSLAPSITNLILPTIAGLTWGQDNIWTYRVIYPGFTVVGFIISVIFFRKVKERLVLPKKKPEPVRFFDAIREVAKNKYFWIIQVAAWVVFLESGYGVVFGYSFVYAYGGVYESYQGLANTIIGNAGLWSMLLAPLAIKVMGKRNLLITANTINIFVLIALYFSYKSLIMICVLWYFNTFVNTFWNIVQHNISADMRDYHQWKTGVRVDGLFGPLGIIGTFIGFFTGMFYPAVYEKMGLHEDYSVLENDEIRNNLFEVLIICSAVGAFLNLVPFLFYNLTENKHKAYIDVLKIRAMFENYSIGMLEDDELEEAMEIINEAESLNGKKKIPKNRKTSKAEKKKIKETNLAIERASIIKEDLNKFSSDAGITRLMLADKDIADGELYSYEDIKAQLKNAKKLPRKTKTDKEIRSDLIRNLKVKKEASKLIRKYGEDNIILPDISVKEEIQNRDSKGFFDSMKLRKELQAYARAVSVYERATRPYADAKRTLEQADNYKYYKELKEKYHSLGVN